MAFIFAAEHSYGHQQNINRSVDNETNLPMLRQEELDFPGWVEGAKASPKL